MTWQEFAHAAPELAARARPLLGRGRVALLGTVRADGSPRISPIEPFLVDGHLLLGVMARSAKARDLVRDARCVLHSSIASPHGGDPELKLYGRVDDAPDDVRIAAADAWWRSHPADAARVVSLSVAEAVLVTWDLARGRMTTARWTPAAGMRERTAAYP